MATVRFGFFPTPNASELDDIVRRVHDAERMGLDFIGIQDHPYQRAFLDPFALIAHLAAVTERIRFVTDVANLPLRGPVQLAKQSATIDLLSGGRFELGLGAGALWDAVAAIGGPRRTPAEALVALDEAITVIRELWSDHRGIRVAGEHYTLDGVHGGPVPAHPIGIVIGGYGPRMLDLIGRRADAWLPSLPFVAPERLDDGHARIDAAAVAAGRDPAEIARWYNVGGRIGGPVEEREGGIVGPVDHWVATLLDLHHRHRIDTFVFWADGDVDEQLGRFGGEVAPAVARELGQAVNAGSPSGPSA